MAVAAYPPPMRINLRELMHSKHESAAPQINLEWEPFASKIDRFLGEVDRYANEARNEIGERNFQHAKSIRDAQARKAETERQIAEERRREGEMLATLDEERRDIQDLNASLSHIRSNISKVREQSQQLEMELNALRKEVTTERAEKERQGKTLKDMKTRDQEDLDALQEAIGWRLEGIGQDKLLMRFTLIDPSDPDREFAIVLDVSKHMYTIPKCSPHLPNLAELLRDLNTDRDLTGFIKRVRKSFKGLCPTSEPGSRLDLLSGVTRTPARSKAERAAVIEDGLEGMTLADKA